MLQEIRSVRKRVTRCVLNHVDPERYDAGPQRSTVAV
jgi:hypothetical protein